MTTILSPRSPGPGDTLTSGNRAVRVRSTFKLQLHRSHAAPALWFLASVALFLVIWQLVAVFVIRNEQLFPPPTSVFSAGWTLLRGGFFQSNVVPSLIRVAIGFSLGSVIGVILGIATGRIPLFRRLLSPILILLRPIPAIALVPVAIVWFGIGEGSKYFVIAYAVALVVWLNTHTGASSVPETYIRAARSLGVGSRRLFFRIVIPSASPFIIAGLRLGASVAFISLIAAELTGASSGIGFQLQESRQYLATDAMFVSLITLGVLGATADLIISSVGRYLLRWEKA